MIIHGGSTTRQKGPRLDNGGKIRIHQLLVGIGGILLALGAVLPWLTNTICMMPPPGPFCVTRYVSGIESFAPVCPASSGSVTAAVGVVLLLVALYEYGRTGQVYSTLAPAVSALCLFPIMGAVLFPPIVSEDHFSPWPGIGFYVSVLGVLLGIFGGLQHVPQPGSFAAEA